MRLDDDEVLLAAYAREIIGYLVKSGAAPAQAQEVTQDIFLQLLEADFEVPPDKLRAWMYRTAVRRYIDTYRRDKRYREILQENFFKPEELIAYDRGDYDFLYEAIAELPDKDRLLLELYYFQGFSTKDIKDVTGFSLPNIKISLMRARKALKTKLEKAGKQHDSI